MPHKKEKKKEKKNIRIKPLVAILCDDIRQEFNGKEILIGIYGGSIITEPPIENIPQGAAIASHRFSLWIPFEAEDVGDASVEFQILVPDGDTVKVNAKLSIHDKEQLKETLAFRFIGFPVLLRREGELIVQYKNDGDEDFKILKKFPIKFVKYSSILPQPLS